MLTLTPPPPPPGCVVNTEEGELSEFDQEVSLTEAEQTLSEEHSYRETMSGVRSGSGLCFI